MSDRAPTNNDHDLSGDGSPWPRVLSDGLTVLADVRSAGFGPQTDAQAETVLSLCHLLLFRMRTRNPYPLIGILGNADSGKSTLLGSVAGREVSRVTPIPHQTAGPILAVPDSFLPWASDPSLLRPVLERVETVPGGTTGLSGSPDRALTVPAWDAKHCPFLLMDLPDVGSLDSLEENQVTVRILPWLDRVLLLLTEETFAQAAHEEVLRNLQILRPERARGELFVVLNRRHPVTTDTEFEDRLDKVRHLWPEATVASLPHLGAERFFSQTHTTPLVSESNPRVLRTLKEAVRTLGEDLSHHVRFAAQRRIAQQRLLRTELQRDIREGCRFSKAFFSEDFRRRLQVFSPWNQSVRRLRSLWRKERTRTPVIVDLLAESPVQRQVAETARRLEQHVARHRAPPAPGPRGAGPLPDPALPAAAIRSAVSALVSRTNEQARTEVEGLLASLQESRKIKDPLWGLVAGVSSTLLLLELVLPGFGTLSSMTFSGLLSALGFGGMLTSDMMRRIRSNRLREDFEFGMRKILEDTLDPLIASGGVTGIRELEEVSRRLSAWAHALKEV